MRLGFPILKNTVLLKCIQRVFIGSSSFQALRLYFIILLSSMQIEGIPALAPKGGRLYLINYQILIVLMDILT